VLFGPALAGPLWSAAMFTSSGNNEQCLFPYGGGWAAIIELIFG
jgi:hypothetical protein